MEEMKRLILSRYGLKGVTTKSSFFYFFGFNENPLNCGRDIIYTRPIMESFRRDCQKLSEDLNRVYKKEKDLADAA